MPYRNGTGSAHGWAINHLLIGVMVALILLAPWIFFSDPGAAYQSSAIHVAIVGVVIALVGVLSNEAPLGAIGVVMALGGLFSYW